MSPQVSPGRSQPSACPAAAQSRKSRRRAIPAMAAPRLVCPGSRARAGTRGARAEAPPPTCRGANGWRERGASPSLRGPGAVAAEPARATYERHGTDPEEPAHDPPSCRRRLPLPRGNSGFRRAPFRCSAAGGTDVAMAGIKGAHRTGWGGRLTVGTRGPRGEGPGRDLECPRSAGRPALR